MLNPNGDAIYSAGLTEFSNLVYDTVTRASKGKSVRDNWEKVYKLIPLLLSIQNSQYLTEKQTNSIYDCIVELLNLNDTSGYPTPVQPSVQVINQGPPGPKGDTGDPGSDGVDGEDAVSIEFLGSFASAPVSPTLNQCYRDTVLKKSRIWDGSVWQDMVLDGVDGADGNDGNDGDPGTDGDSAYMYQASADDASGTGFTYPYNPAQNYRAIINTTTEIVSPAASDFLGHWYKATGTDGADGTDGVDGSDGINGTDGDDGAPGTPSYIYIAYADSISGTGYILVSSNDTTATLNSFNSTKEWIAVITSATAIGATITASNFSGRWAKYQGTGDRWTTYSTTSLAIATGSKTLSVEANLAYSTGQGVVIADPSDYTNRMEGFVISYNQATGNLIVDVTNAVGSGTFAVWAVSLQSVTADPATTYAGDSPSTVTVNDLPSGTTLTGLTFEHLLERVFAPFIPPTFSSFVMDGQAVSVEVGTTVSGSKTFTWGTTNSSNVSPNTITVRDETNASNLSTGLANDGTESIAITSVQKTSAASHIWRIIGTDLETDNFQKDFTIDWKWLLYYGTSSSTTLDETAIEALSDTSLETSIDGVYSFTTGDYKYFVWDDSLGSPAALIGFVDNSTNLPITMADSTDNAFYSTTDNGWSYGTVSVTNAQAVASNKRIYRTKYILGGSIDIKVTS